MSLYEAIASDDFQLFLSHLPENVNNPMHKDYYPFITCAYFNRIEMMEHLLESRDVNIWVINNYKSNALHVAVYMHNLDCVKFLCDKCPSLSLGVDRWGRTPLHTAAMNGSVEIVKLLVNAGSDLTIRDKYGKTPEQHTSYENIRKILQNGQNYTC